MKNSASILEELETLSYIYNSEEFQILNEKQILFNLSEESLKIEVEIEFTDFYPEEFPLIKVLNLDDFDDETRIDRLIIDIKTQLIIGMAMCFTVISCFKDFLVDLNEHQIQTKANLDMLEEMEEMRILDELEEQRLMSKVTIEKFTEWNELFKQEFNKNNINQHQIKDFNKKLTGKQLFEKDFNLVNSDMALIDDGDMTIDVALFEKMEYIEDSDSNSEISFSEED